MRSFWFCLFFLLYVNQRECANSEQCLLSPPELELSAKIDGDGNTFYSGTIRFDAKLFSTQEHGYPTSFTSRVYNGMLPGPTIRFQRGNIYHIDFYNDLEAEHPNDPAVMNTYHYSNTSNLHTHGLHISPQPPSDDAFITVSPGEYFEYIYYIPCHHHGGTNFYHPHHHGSSALQLGGGAVGAIIINDGDGSTENLPNWLLSIDEMILMIQYIDLEHLLTFTNLKYDMLSKVDAPEMFYLMNGAYQPSICLNINEWKLLRIIYSDVSYDTEIKFGDADKCTVYLVAKDGVYVDNGIRLLQTNLLYFTQSSRVDIAIKCDDSGEFDIIAWDHKNNNGMMAMRMGRAQNIKTVHIATIVVHVLEKKSETNVIDIAEFNPLRPNYLSSLLDYGADEVDNFWNVRFQGMMGYTINNRLFNGSDAYQMEIGVNEINEWHVTMEGMMQANKQQVASNIMRMSNGNGNGNEKGSLMIHQHHKIHIHVNHFQIMDGSVLPGTDPNFTLVGDWLDNAGLDTRIRFLSHTFGEKILLHCHILAHEDKGMMAVFRIVGGCNPMDIECIDKDTNCARMNANMQEIFGFVEDAKHNSFVHASEWISNSRYIIFLFIGGICVCVILTVIAVVWFTCNQKNQTKSVNVMYGSC